MTANHEHTPSQEMFRLAYKHILDNWLITPEGRQQALGEYDRMIAQVEAAAEQRGAIKALRDAAKELSNGKWLGVRSTDSKTNDPNAIVSTARWLNNRADQEVDDE